MTAEESFDWYVLFPNHTEGLKLYKYAREQGIKVRISPAPREATVCCGMSLLVDESDIDAVRRCIGESATEIDRIVRLLRRIDPARNKFC